MPSIIRNPAAYKYFLWAEPFKFKVCTGEDVFLCIATGATDAKIQHTVHLGHTNNTASSINPANPIWTPQIMSATQFRGFWMSLADNMLSVGYHGSDELFMFEYPVKSPNITHVGIKCGEKWKAGTWIIETDAASGQLPPDTVAGGLDGSYKMPLVIRNPRQYEYFLWAEPFKFKVRADQDVQLCLASGPSDAQIRHTVHLGFGHNTTSSINQTNPISTHKILSASKYRGFWISLADNMLSVGRDGSGEPLMFEYLAEQPYITHVGIRCGLEARAGTWIIATDVPRWLPAAAGQLPADAVVGGLDGGEPQYVARARIAAGQLPGKLVASHGVTYVSHADQVHACEEYEVLCNCRAEWRHITDKTFRPLNALIAGKSEADGDDVYVGRVWYKGTLMVGRIGAATWLDRACFVTYKGEELRFTAYQILVADAAAYNIGEGGYCCAGFEEKIYDSQTDI